MSSKHLNAQYNLRWPDELKEKIAQSAKEHNRSMNADIVARLENSFESNKFDPVFDDLLRVFKEANDETTRLQSELIKIINEQKAEIEHFKKAP